MRHPFRFLAVAFSFATLCRHAPAQAIELIYKWEPGETIATRLTIENSRSVGSLKDTSPDQPERPQERTRRKKHHDAQPREDDPPAILPLDDGTRSQKLVCDFEQTVRSVDEAGAASIEMTCRRVDAGADLSDTERFTFDSARPSRSAQGSSPRQQKLANLVGKTIRMKIGRDGAMLETVGIDPLVEALTALQNDNALGVALVDELRAKGDGGNSGLDDAFTIGPRFLPAGLVRRGQVWATDVEHTLPIVGRINSKWTSTLARVARNGASTIATITSKADILISPPAEVGSGAYGLMPGIDLEFLPGKGEAEITFDVAHGRATKAEMSTSLNVVVRVGELGGEAVDGVTQELRCRMVHEVVSDKH